MKSLGDAELEIMKVLWKAGDKVSSTYILAALDGKLNWKLSTLMTVLTRLEKKGFLVCDRQTRTNLYQASIREKEYMAEESREFLEKLYDNSVENFITGLYNSKILKNTDLDELRVFWINWRNQRNGIRNFSDIYGNISFRRVNIRHPTGTVSHSGAKICREVEVLALGGTGGTLVYPCKYKYTGISLEPYCARYPFTPDGR